MTEHPDFGSRVGGALADLTPSPGLADRIAARVDERARRQRAARAASAALAAVVLIAGAVGLTRLRQDHTVVADERGPRWELLPSAPIPPRVDPAAVWTGTEVLVWGGRTDPSSSRSGVRGDGAAYDPVSRRWRVLPLAPIGPRNEPEAVWTGTEMLVWGGQQPEGPGPAGWADGAAYDPARNAWRRIPDAPIGSRVSVGTAWTGKELVVIGGVPAGGAGDRQAIGAAYDPARNAWRLLPDLGFEGHTGAWAAWTGSEVLYWRPHGETMGVPALYGYDPDADRWRQHRTPAAEIRLVWDAAAFVWTGSEILVASGTYTAHDGEMWSHVEAVAYDPADERWRRLHRSENPYARLMAPHMSRARWTGRELVLLDVIGSGGSVFDPGAGRWRALPSTPDGLRDPAAVATDDGEVYVFGGGVFARLVRTSPP